MTDATCTRSWLCCCSFVACLLSCLGLGFDCEPMLPGHHEPKRRDEKPSTWWSPTLQDCYRGLNNQNRVLGPLY